MGAASVVTAIATSIIALLVIAIGIALLGLTRRLSRLVPTLERLLATLESELGPTLQSARTATDAASSVAGALRDEVDGITATSRDVRRRVKRAVTSAEERLWELEDLLDVLQDEVEETVLTLATALRASRRGASIFGAMKRVFLGSRRSG